MELLSHGKVVSKMLQCRRDFLNFYKLTVNEGNFNLTWNLGYNYKK